MVYLKPECPTQEKKRELTDIMKEEGVWEGKGGGEVCMAGKCA